MNELELTIFAKVLRSAHLVRTYALGVLMSYLLCTWQKQTGLNLPSVKSDVVYNGHLRLLIDLSRRLYAKSVESIYHVNERQKRQAHWQDLEG
jgi:hypothetical protein